MAWMAMVFAKALCVSSFLPLVLRGNSLRASDQDEAGDTGFVAHVVREPGQLRPMANRSTGRVEDVSRATDAAGAAV
jgi:hypothetical protein